MNTRPAVQVLPCTGRGRYRGAMANITRRQRESRAYQLTLATGGGALATVVLGLLWVVLGIGSFGLVALVAVLTVVCAVLLRRVFQK